MAAVNVPDCRLSIEGVERDLGLTAETIALALGVDRRTIDSWRANQSVPQGKPRVRLAQLLALHDRLLAVLGSPTAAQQWLRARSLYLGGSRLRRRSELDVSIGSVLISTDLPPACTSSRVGRH